MLEKGIVFDIQRFSMHDGPGIRTTVFLKGCPLQCAWCHNPESWKMDPQIMMKPDGSTRLCGTEMTVSQVMDEVMADAPYYRNSGGGLTVSGGEPMLQFDFTKALLTEVKMRGIHTCIETSGFAPVDKYIDILSLVDLFLWDIKETNPEKHKMYTGVDNSRILHNLEMLYHHGAKIQLRCPIIPGINDTDEHIIAVSQLAQKYPGLRGVEIMPYHELGKGKWKEIDREYTLSELKSVTAEEQQILLHRFKEAGCPNIWV